VPEWEKEDDEICVMIRYVQAELEDHLAKLKPALHNLQEKIQESFPGEKERKQRAAWQRKRAAEYEHHLAGPSSTLSPKAAKAAAAVAAAAAAKSNKGAKPKVQRKGSVSGNTASSAAWRRRS
ncbi:unnamed protein product, partial [Heterosigma akashiwo]